MAVKVFSNENRQGRRFGDNFDQERTILSKFKEALISVSAVTVNFAAFVHGEKLNIISEYADMDLADLLAGECQDFSSLASDRSKFTPRNLLKEAFQLFEALTYLHNGIALSISSRPSIVHMDLKPDNILVFGPFDSTSRPVGTWKISDFNLAESTDVTNTRPASARPAGMATTLGGLIREKSSRPGREGAYLPPELRRRNQLQADKKTDVWSLGCIMAVVLAFALDGPAGVSHLQTLRENDRNDYFYDIAPDGTSIPKRNLTEWLQGSLGRLGDHPWTSCWQNLVTAMLNIDRTARPSMSGARDLITPVYNAMQDNRKGFTRLWNYSNDWVTQDSGSSQMGSPAIPTSSDSGLPSSLHVESGLPSPGGMIQSLLGSEDDIWTFLRLDFQGIASRTTLCPSGRRACMWNRKLMNLYDITFKGPSQPLWQTGQREARAGEGPQAVANWQTDAFEWNKIRIVGQIVAAHLLPRDKAKAKAKVCRDAFILNEADQHRNAD